MSKSEMSKILNEWKIFLNEDQSNESPSWIKKNGLAIYKNKKVEILEPDIRGPFVLINLNGKEKSVNYNELSKPNE